MEKEKCVVCNTETNEYVHTNVDYRFYYVEGAGQLCKECYENVYDNKKEKNEQH